MLNKATLIGRLGKDPEVRYLPDGTTVASFSMACGQDYKDKNGNKQSGAEWINCTVFGKMADVAANHLQKGSKIYCEGKIQTRSWEGQDGVKRYTTEVRISNFIFLDNKQSGGEATAGQDYSGDQFNGGGMTTDDVPF